MKRIVFFLCILCLFFTNISGQYMPDYLGEEYTCRVFQMPDDYDGKVVTTLIKKKQHPAKEKAFLYVHGYNDYFFQTELADSVEAHGYNFYALDLRKYGRSLLAEQDTFFVKDIKEYYADLDTAIYTILQEGNKDIVLMGHSTGGLITSLYLNDRGGEVPVRALILNSPFLDMNMSWVLENIGVPLVSFIGKYFPYLEVQGRGLSMYAESLLKQYHGEWDYNTDWKLVYGHPIKAGWIRAIHQAHNRVQDGLNIQVPVLLMSSDQSIKEKKTWNEDYRRADIVLDVEDIQKYGRRLGAQVTPVTVAGGIHDLVLSLPTVRGVVYNVMFDWIDKNVQ
ncbi:alpha/beta hydrolase [Parabacteroides pacaensis]|uniref:alpha/beta hydrolase n=1 Tax=Parabacteroides pacaensis TaxID=2086575 RepID=UPI000D0EC84B|nr:alpha/beta hydrolase [Parabacteroides pacaensis]